MEAKEIIYGRKPVLEYMKTAAPGSGGELFVSRNAHGKIIDILLNEAKAKKIPVSYRDKDFFKNISSSSEHQGIALRITASRKKNDDQDIVTWAAENKGVLVLLDEITDPHNVGSIIRTAEALGCGGIILTKSNSPGINPTVIKSSAGATAHMPVQSISNISGFLEGAKKSGFWIIGTSDHGDKNPWEIGGYRPAIIIIGSEGTGMRRIVEEQCDYIVKIPLRGKVSSLNASVAAGIILYEAMKKGQ